jgi:hypothetical protein
VGREIIKFNFGQLQKRQELRTHRWGTENKNNSNNNNTGRERPPSTHPRWLARHLNRYYRIIVISISVIIAIIAIAIIVNNIISGIAISGTAFILAQPTPARFTVASAIGAWRPANRFRGASSPPQPTRPVGLDWIHFASTPAAAAVTKSQTENWPG